MKRPMRIGEVAEAAGVNIQTLRFYERRGLIPLPRRSSSGYRVYSPEAVRHVRAIKWIQSLGSRLEVIKDIIRIWDAHVHGRNAMARSRAEAKIREIDDEVRRLHAVRETLSTLAACPCDGDFRIVEEALQARSRTSSPRRGTRKRAGVARRGGAKR